MAKFDKIWDEVEKLAVQAGMVNLGHGYPDFEPPLIIREALMEMTMNPSSPFVHQYARSSGHLRLVKILAKINSQLLGVPVDPLNNILITIGATHALYLSVTGLLKPHHEVIMFEPYFTLYDGIVRKSGATGVYVTLNLDPTSQSGNIIDGNYTFDREELESKFNKNTKLFILNNPNNPYGKVFTKDELNFISELCIKHDVIAISDEVYYRLVHPPNKHISIASLPGMWDRTITIGSAGKCFSVTGWKTGWCIGPKHLLNIVENGLRITVYNCCTPIQEALAIAFEKEMEAENDETSFVKTATKELKEKFKKVADMLISVGMIPIAPQAGYFLIADISKTDFQANDSSEYGRDVQFCMWMLTKYKIASIPLKVFLTNKSQNVEENYIRLCCYKSDETLRKAEECFNVWKTNLENK